MPLRLISSSTTAWAVLVLASLNMCLPPTSRTTVAALFQQTFLPCRVGRYGRDVAGHVCRPFQLPVNRSDLFGGNAVSKATASLCIPCQPTCCSDSSGCRTRCIRGLVGVLRRRSRCTSLKCRRNCLCGLVCAADGTCRLCRTFYELERSQHVASGLERMPLGPLSARDIIHHLPNVRRRSEPRSESDAHFARGSEQRSPVLWRVVSLQSSKGGFTDIAINRRERRQEHRQGRRLHRWKGAESGCRGAPAIRRELMAPRKRFARTNRPTAVTVAVTLAAHRSRRDFRSSVARGLEPGRTLCAGVQAGTLDVHSQLIER